MVTVDTTSNRFCIIKRRSFTLFWPGGSVTVRVARGYCHPPPHVVFLLLGILCFCGLGLVVFYQFQFCFWVLGGVLLVVGGFGFFFQRPSFFFSATIDFLFSAVFVFRGFGPATFVFFVDGEMHFCNGLLVCVQVDGCSILFHSMFLLTTVLFASVV